MATFNCRFFLSMVQLINRFFIQEINKDRLLNNFFLETNRSCKLQLNSTEEK